MDKQEIVELLALHEETISKLYTVISKRFFEYQNFWEKLADEEMQHAGSIRILLLRIQDDLGIVNSEKFSFSKLSESLADIQGTIGRVGEPDFTLQEALSLSLSIEESLFEGKYFDVFVGNCAEVKQVQYCLKAAVKDHCQRIRQMAARVKDI